MYYYQLPQNRLIIKVKSESPEYIRVEKPTIDQLVSMGWQYMLSDKFNYKVTERDNSKQVLLINRLKAAMTYKGASFICKLVRTRKLRV